MTMIRNIRRLLACAVLALLALPAFAVTTDIYYHNDLAGTPLAATDHAGNVLWRQSYRPYGERLDPKAPAEQLPWYTGKAHVEAAGLSYYGARWYDPALGRFMGVDPVGFSEANVHSFNRYAYANNNPYKFVDPDGRAAETVFDLISFGISVEMFRREPTLGNFLGAAVDGLAVAVPFVPGGIGAIRSVGKAAETAREVETAAKGVDTAAKRASDAIQVTKSGVALPPGQKHQIPDGYVQNPHRTGSYGEIVDGKFKERLRIDPPTPAGQKGPDYSHYHRDGKGTHYSPRSGDKDPGFGP